MPLLKIKNIQIVCLITPYRHVLALHDFSTALCQIPGGPGCHMVPYESAHCDDNFAGLPDPALCCSIAMCVFSVPFVSERDWERHEVGWESGCLGQDPSVPALRPTEPSARTGQTRRGPAGHAQLTHQGLDGEMPDALIKLMLFVDFLCMDANVAACQRVVSHASWM